MTIFLDLKGQISFPGQTYFSFVVLKVLYNKVKYICNVSWLFYFSNLIEILNEEDNFLQTALLF